MSHGTQTPPGANHTTQATPGQRQAARPGVGHKAAKGFGGLLGSILGGIVSGMMQSAQSAQPTQNTTLPPIDKSADEARLKGDIATRVDIALRRELMDRTAEYRDQICERVRVEIMR